jgi:hypothetical protein
MRAAIRGYRRLLPLTFSDNGKAAAIAHCHPDVSDQRKRRFNTIAAVGNSCAEVQTMTVTNRLLLKTELGFPASKSVGRSFLILALLFICFFLASCTGGDGLLDFDKIDAFEAMFTVGMSKQEVEEILEGMEGVSLNEYRQLGGCPVWAIYNTSPEHFGSSIFTFCYDSNMKLKYITYSIVE